MHLQKPAVGVLDFLDHCRGTVNREIKKLVLSLGIPILTRNPKHLSGIPILTRDPDSHSESRVFIRSLRAELGSNAVTYWPNKIRTSYNATKRCSL